MKQYNTSQLRNVALVGHGGDGKTTLSEAMLFAAGITDRQGRVEEGNTVTDFDQEEHKRQISISTAFAPVEWKDHKINVIDVPGFFDFEGEAYSAYYLCDSALILISAHSGLSVGCEKAYDYLKKHNIPRAIFVNQMDKENANFTKCLNELKNKYGSAVTPLQLPIGDGLNFSGAVDVIEMKAYKFENKKATEIPVPADMAAQVKEIRDAIIENAAENDEELMEKFFGGEDLSKDDILKGLKLGIQSGSTVPVFLGAAAPNLGVSTLLDNIVSFLPAPFDTHTAKNTKNDTEETLAYDSTKPFVAQVYKTVADAFVGKLSIFKVLQGTLAPDTHVINANHGKAEKQGTLYIVKGKDKINAEKLCAGDIGAVAKLAVTNTGDTLCDAAHSVVCGEVAFPAPSLSLAIYAKKQGDEDKVFSGLYKLAEEDPTCTISKNTETGETLINGMGELHIEIICRKLQNKFHVDAELKDPRIPYRETIKSSAEAEGKHKKQSGGAGQFGVVNIRFEPVHGKDFEFVNAIVGGVVPREYVPAVEKGLREAMVRGVLAGYPMTGVKATLFDGKYHPVDSKEIAFKSAARLSYKAACAKANPVILEPIYKVCVTIPDDYMGDIIGDLNRRRGRILGMNPGDGVQVVEAEVPVSEMFKYATDLRSMTHARGTFTLTFERYDELPGNLAQKVVEQAKKDLEEEE